MTKKASKRPDRAKASKEKTAPAVRDVPAGEGAPVTALLDRNVGILEQARARVVRAVDSEMVLAYWHIGREIVEHQQGGDVRAAYGKSSSRRSPSV